jgi:hypothetical protein
MTSPTDTGVKPTSGPVEHHVLMVTKGHETLVHFGISNNFRPPRPDECVANAALFAEAINVRHETGLTPRELASALSKSQERVRELEAALAPAPASPATAAPVSSNELDTYVALLDEILAINSRFTEVKRLREFVRGLAPATAAPPPPPAQVDRAVCGTCGGTKVIEYKTHDSEEYSKDCPSCTPAAGEKERV